MNALEMRLRILNEEKMVSEDVRKYEHERADGDEVAEVAHVVETACGETEEEEHEQLEGADPADLGGAVLAEGDTLERV